MYVVRRGDRWWFRKAIPVDLVDVLGIAEVRRSLRTRSTREARRRALEVPGRLEAVYAVPRSERPMRPARDVALALLDEALRTNSGTAATFEGTSSFSRKRPVPCAGPVTATGPWSQDPTPPVRPRTRRPSPISFVGTGDALSMLRGERPKGEENKIAVAMWADMTRVVSCAFARVLTHASDGRCAFVLLSSWALCMTMSEATDDKHDREHLLGMVETLQAENAALAARAGAAEGEAERVLARLAKVAYQLVRFRAQEFWDRAPSAFGQPRMSAREAAERRNRRETA